jgi:hypothetical protein
MADSSNKSDISTPLATAATAQTRDASAEETPASLTPICKEEGTAFSIGPGVERAVYGRPYERSGNDPVYRPLKIFTIDPAESRLEGSIAIVNVPYEPLEPGPVGRVFEVDNYDGWQSLRRVSLDDPDVLIRNGRDPSPSDPRFHQQMVYAVCSTVYAAFRSALGRHIAWGFDSSNVSSDGAQRLRIRPHACNERNAYYDKERGELCFGHYRADREVGGRNLPGSRVFTCLSHDIVAHEVTHALLDGLRTHFTLPSGPDVLAFHEAFADLVAIFQHFSYEKVLQSAIRKSRGNLKDASLLTDIARQFGHTTGQGRALRSAVENQIETGPLKVYGADREPHHLGSVLVSAVFEAFETIFKRKTERYIKLATGGSGVLPPGDISADLQKVLADEASKLASQFLSICIRAIDYCPPFDLEFGEFLRAVITADYNLVPDDPWGYREALIDAFKKREIYPRYVDNFSEDALLWRAPENPVPDIRELSFAILRFEGDPGRPSGQDELRRQACALGRIISDPQHLKSFGFARRGDPRLGQDLIEPPCIQSIRSSRRAGPDGQIVFDLVAEATQRRTVLDLAGKPEFDFYGGATITLGPSGEVRYSISKSVLNEERIKRQRAFIYSDAGRHYWTLKEGRASPNSQLFRLLHA